MAPQCFDFPLLSVFFSLLTSHQKMGGKRRAKNGAPKTARQKRRAKNDARKTARQKRHVAYRSHYWGLKFVSACGGLKL